MLNPIDIERLLAQIKTHEAHFDLIIQAGRGDPNKPPPKDLAETYQRSLRVKHMRSYLEHALWEAEYYVQAYDTNRAQRMLIHDALLDTAQSLPELEEQVRLVNIKIEQTQSTLIQLFQNGTIDEKVLIENNIQVPHRNRSIRQD